MSECICKRKHGNSEKARRNCEALMQAAQERKRLGKRPVPVGKKARRRKDRHRRRHTAYRPSSSIR